MVPQLVLDLIKKYEGLSLTPYLCPAKIPTIGYGFTTYLDGTYVTLDDKALSTEEAERILAVKVEKFYTAVTEMMSAPLNTNQLSALTSLAYNIGLTAFRNSTLRRVVNEDPSNARVRYEFSRWNKANGTALAGLIKRRKDEANLYFKTA